MNIPIYWNISWTVKCLDNSISFSELNKNNLLESLKSYPSIKIAKILKNIPNIIYIYKPLI